MRRFFVEDLRIENGSCLISGSEARHMMRVIRMRRGDRFVLMGGKGERYLSVIRSTNSREVLVDIEKKMSVSPPSPVEITLCQSLLRSNPMDYLIQKTSELGVDRILPFVSSRTVAKIAAGKIDKRVRHWQNVATSAAKQCGRPVPAMVSPPVSLPDLLAGLPRCCSKTVFWEEEETAGFKRFLKEAPKTETFIGMVGPEGGFSEEEVSISKEAGFVSVSLGERVLRAETAALAMVGLVQYEWGDLGEAGDRLE